jgi:orotate phosphoribosyltransferase-like protein
MVRKYTHVKQIEPIVLEMKTQGKSHTEIAEELNLSKQQIKELMKRYRRRQAKLKEGIPNKGRGRPRTSPIDKWKALEAENARLKMENELLRDFLSAIERM